MDTTNMDERQFVQEEEQEIDLVELALKIWKERKFLLKLSGMAIVVGLIIAFSIPKEYTTTVKLAPISLRYSQSSKFLERTALKMQVRLSYFIL